MPSEELVEKWAIKLALGNNGGSWSCNMPFKNGQEPFTKDCDGKWANHYNEEHRHFWRGLAREALIDIEVDLHLDKSILIKESEGI